ncbi:MAG: hypothetical protein HQ485_03845 [Acidobacteria bacterium]|jgi:uncharacterized membrane protein|nr:hypothetical protein [Acidobacteriota bacterium]
MTRDPKLMAALSYSVGIASAIIILAIEKKDAFVRFHAVQSVLVFSAIALMSLLLPTIPILGNWTAVRVLFVLGVVGLWGFLMFKAVRGEAYRLPYLGDLAANLSSPGQ